MRLRVRARARARVRARALATLSALERRRWLGLVWALRTELCEVRDGVLLLEQDADERGDSGLVLVVQLGRQRDEAPQRLTERTAARLRSDAHARRGKGVRGGQARRLGATSGRARRLALSAVGCSRIA